MIQESSGRTPIRDKRQISRKDKEDPADSMVSVARERTGIPKSLPAQAALPAHAQPGGWDK